MKKRVFSLILAVIMTVTTLPLVTGAGDKDHVHVISDVSVTFDKWESTNSLPTEGNWYLTDNVNLTGNWSVSKNVNLCLNGFIIKRTGGNCVTVLNGGCISIHDCSNAEHFFTDDGTGLWVLDESKGDKKVTGGCIMGVNPGAGDTDGIGIFVNGGGTLNLCGGNVVGNKATNTGGGIHVCEGAAFNMYGGCICGNVANNYGGGVYNKGTFTMNGGKIAYNTAKMSGGGIYVAASGKFTVTGGEIKNNSAEGHAGGIYGSKDLTITGGKITANTAKKYGGGIYVASGNIKVTGGEITGNHADLNGGGVHIYSVPSGPFTFGGSTVITGNTAGEKNVGSNLNLNETKNLTIGADGDKPTKDMLIGITLGGEGRIGQFTTNGASTDTVYFFSDDPTLVPIFNAGNYLEMVKGNTITVKVNDAKMGTASANYTAGVKDMTITLNATPSDGYVLDGWESSDVTVSENKFTMPDKAVTVTAKFRAAESYPILVNGKAITENTKDDVLQDGNKMMVYDPAAKTLYVNGNCEVNRIEIIGDGITVMPGDSAPNPMCVSLNGPVLIGKPNANITATFKGNGKKVMKIVPKLTDEYNAFRPVAIREGNTLVMEKNATIQGSRFKYADSANGGGGAVLVSKNATFIMDGSNILDCQVISDVYDALYSRAGRGGAVYVEEGGKLIMKNTAEIENCSASVAGGGIYSKGTVEMYGKGTEIFDCSVTGLKDGSVSKAKGGAVYILAGTFNMFGGYIDTNTLGENEVMNGAGVYVAESGKINLGGSARIYNNADGYGDDNNLYLHTGATAAFESSSSDNKPDTENLSIHVTLGTENGTGKFASSDTDYGTYVIPDNPEYLAVFNTNEIDIIGTVAYNYTQGIKYSSLSDAMNEAVSGDEIEVWVEENDEDVVLPLGVTLYTKSGYTGEVTTTEIGKTVVCDFMFGQFTYKFYLADALSIVYKDKGGAAFSGTHEAGYPETYCVEAVTVLGGASKTGYTFDGWFDNENCEGESITGFYPYTYFETLTLYAKWTANTVTVTFDKNGGDTDADPKEITETYDGKFILPATAPTKEGFVFDGWYTETEAGTKITGETDVKFTESKTLYAHWTSKEVPPATGDKTAALLMGTALCSLALCGLVIKKKKEKRKIIPD